MTVHSYDVQSASFFREELNSKRARRPRLAASDVDDQEVEEMRNVGH